MRLASCSLSLPTKHARGRWKQNSKQRSGTLRVMDSCSSSGWPSSCFSLLRSCWVVCSAVGVMDVGVGAGRWLSGGQELAADGAVDAAAGAGGGVAFPAGSAASGAGAERERDLEGQSGSVGVYL